MGSNGDVSALHGLRGLAVHFEMMGLEINQCRLWNFLMRGPCRDSLMQKDWRGRGGEWA